MMLGRVNPLLRPPTPLRGAGPCGSQPASRALGVDSLPARLGADAAFAGAGADQVALELRKPAKHGQHQAAVRRGRVRPYVGKGFEGRAAFRDLRQDVQQVAGGSRQPVKSSPKGKRRATRMVIRPPP